MATKKSKKRESQFTQTQLQLSFGERLIAGAASRGIAQTSLHPVDVLRTRMQAKFKGLKPIEPATFLKGILPQILLAVPSGALQFCALDYTKQKLKELDPDNKHPTAAVIISSFFGSLSSMITRVPQEVIKQGIQAELYPDMASAVRTIFQQSGVAGFYKGALATMSRDIPWNTLSFLIHHRVKQIFRNVKKRDPTDRENLLLASLSGGCAAGFTTPIDVIKTRIMTARGSDVSRGIIQTLQGILQEEGASTLFKGLFPRVLYLGPLAGIFISVYEAVSRLMIERKQANLKSAGPPNQSTRFKTMASNALSRRHHSMCLLA